LARFTQWLESFVLAIGAPGLFVIAFLDSSFLSFPEINDFLIIWMVTQHEERMVLYASMATLGSIAGCLALYFAGLKGGDALLRRRFRADRLDRATELMRRHGALALLVPALLPPPAPFKIFVLMGGVARIPLKTFVMAIGIGRGVRYFGEGILAVLWGDQALAFIRENGRMIGIVLAVAVLIGGIVYGVRQSRARA
jgi:membrane protein YqaA with SNARE-associated domain